MLVIDASVAVAASYAADGFDGARTPSVRRLERGPVERSRHKRLGAEAWRISEEFGWAKTYDAEYVALALLADCRLVTLDARLRRATRRLGFVLAPNEL